MTDEATPEEIWAAFILSRKNQYLDSYRSDIGREYNSNSAWWDSLAEREWDSHRRTLASRIRSRASP